MAETAKGKKIVWVRGYTRADGTKVPTHERSTPDIQRASQTPDSSADASQVVGLIGTRPPALPSRLPGSHQLGSRGRPSAHTEAGPCALPSVEGRILIGDDCRKSESAKRYSTRRRLAASAMTLLWLLIWFIAGQEALILDPVNAWAATLILAVGLDLARAGVFPQSGKRA